mgnify:FL=1
MSGNHNKNHFAAAYIRVSTENQTELSPSSQLKIIRKFADEKGYLIPYQTAGREVVKVGVEFSAEKRNIGRWLL